MAPSSHLMQETDPVSETLYCLVILEYRTIYRILKAGDSDFIISLCQYFYELIIQESLEEVFLQCSAFNLYRTFLYILPKSKFPFTKVHDIISQDQDHHKSQYHSGTECKITKFDLILYFQILDKSTANLYRSSRFSLY
jgi:hypothetical protein